MPNHNQRPFKQAGLMETITSLISMPPTPREAWLWAKDFWGAWRGR